MLQEVKEMKEKLDLLLKRLDGPDSGGVSNGKGNGA
jgi:hypothetical protein